MNISLALFTCMKPCCGCTSDDLPYDRIPAEATEVLFTNLGLEQDHPVVVYSECTFPKVSAAAISDGLEQALVAYPFPVGCRKVMLLDGGLSRMAIR